MSVVVAKVVARTVLQKQLQKQFEARKKVEVLVVVAAEKEVVED